MEFLPKVLNDYIEKHSQPEDELLTKINRETNLEVNMPRMLSGHLQGRVLSMLSKMIKPSLILEIGTYTGYSALCLAEGLVENGKIITIDINNELEKRVHGYFNESTHSHKIDYKIGDATSIIPDIEEELDLVFIDADKINYSNYFHLVIDQVKSGGFIIADNVLWSGNVIPQMRKKDKIDEDTQAIIDFNILVHEDKRVENVLFPIRDGLMVARKY